MYNIANGQICPVCGKHTFEEDDNFEICPICGWEDDGIQRDDPDYCGGANKLSLNEYRKKYKEAEIEFEDDNEE